MTQQEMFDTILTHLDQQGHRAMGEQGCVYQASNGDKCAVGCLITGYDPNMDRDTWAVDELIVRGHLPTKDRDDGIFLCKMQDLHDEEYWVEIPLAAQEIAKVFNLNTEVLDKLTFEPH